jgi:hypothetical protein
MPSLLEIGGTDDVRYRYSRRTVILVEGPGDKNAFEAIVGPGYEADIEFRVAPTAGGQGGCRAVRDRVPEMRAGNPRIFGLLDGEVAASVAATTTLLDCTDTLFTVPGEDGIIFLGVHELENIYLQWADVPAILADHSAVARIHLHPAPSIALSLDDLIRRFARASVYKYTSAHFHSAGTMRNILSTRIFGQGSYASMKPTLVAAVTSGGQTTWQAFVAELVRVGRAARAAFRRAATSNRARRSWLLRIADGKELLNRLRQMHGNIGDAAEGAMLRDVCRSGYPEQFRAALFALTGTVPSTFAA